MPAHTVLYLLVVWLACLSVASWLAGGSAPDNALVTTLFVAMSVSMSVLGAVWACLVARRGRSRWALFGAPVGAALLATVLTSVAVLTDPDSGLDSFYPAFLIPVYAIVLGVPVWVGGSIGGVWRFVDNRRQLSTNAGGLARHRTEEWSAPGRGSAASSAEPPERRLRQPGKEPP